MAAGPPCEAADQSGAARRRRAWCLYLGRSGPDFGRERDRNCRHFRHLGRGAERRGAESRDGQRWPAGCARQSGLVLGRDQQDRRPEHGALDDRFLARQYEADAAGLFPRRRQNAKLLNLKKPLKSHLAKTTKCRLLKEPAKDKLIDELRANERVLACGE